MKKIFILGLLTLLIVGCATSKEDVSKTENKKQNTIEDSQLQIQVSDNEHTIIFQLNNSQAAKDLYDQLPLTLEVSDYSTNEKIFYPPSKLDTSDGIEANAKLGTLAYYEPWQDVVMFYDDFGKGNQLYELGQAISGREDIQNLSGIIEITVIK